MDCLNELLFKWIFTDSDEFNESLEKLQHQSNIVSSSKSVPEISLHENIFDSSNSDSNFG